MKNSYLTLSILLFVVVSLKAQKSEEKQKYFWSYHKEVGIDMTPLVSQVIPFNLRESSLSPLVALKTKWYGRKRALVVNFASDLAEQSINSFFLSLGMERRRIVHKKITYTTGFDFGVLGDPQTLDFFGPSFFLSRPYGLEYHFNESIFISTEARFMFGFGDGDLSFIRLRPPTSIFINVRF